MEVQSATGRDPEDIMDIELSSKMTASQFAAKYLSRIFLVSSGWLIVNIVFFGLIILIDQPTKVIGLNKGIFYFYFLRKVLILICTYVRFYPCCFSLYIYIPFSI
jgi:hypothetical protein